MVKGIRSSVGTAAEMNPQIFRGSGALKRCSTSGLPCGRNDPESEILDSFLGLSVLRRG